MSVEDLVRHFIEASISGASKTQVIRKFKETYNLDNNQLKKLQILASFKGPLSNLISIFWSEEIIKGLEERLCGIMGIMLQTSKLGWIIGPPADKA